ncbi:MAG: ATP-binding cassette domain-containing protein [Chloroflexota bacterium]|nr:ATP-binding cassette domain-containing protein [Chloroflexota bacterium]
MATTTVEPQVETPGLPLVEMLGISKSFGAVRAVVEASLSIRAAEVVGIVGDNAAGKSTLMKVLSGAHEPTVGEIRMGGVPVRFTSPHDARRRGIEMVYQNFALVPQLDIAANIFLGREPVRSGLASLVGLLNRPTMDTETRKLFGQLGVDIGSVRAKVRTLSGGQQQAVAIARAMAFEARLIIMDEPTANLSVSGIEMVRGVIRTLKGHGISVIVISHRLEDIFAVADRVLVMKRGRVIGGRAMQHTDMDEVLQMIVTGAAETSSAPTTVEDA